MSAPVPAGGGGSTAVLGVKLGRDLAKTGVSWVRAVWTAVAGLTSIVGGAILRGRGRTIRTGEPLAG